MCVKPEALLYALAARVRKGEVPLTERDITTLLAAGCSRDAMRTAFAGVAGAEVVERVLG